MRPRRSPSHLNLPTQFRVPTVPRPTWTLRTNASPPGLWPMPWAYRSQPSVSDAGVVAGLVAQAGQFHRVLNVDG